MNASGLAAFSRALRDPRAACPRGLSAWNGSDVAPRLAVYRNNVLSALTDVLAQTYPVVRELVGAGFFAALAARFVRAHPPRSPVLARYGGRLPGFVAADAAAAALPYLADVARLEWARCKAWQAADAPLLPATTLARALADPRRLPRLRLRLQPSLALLRSGHAIAALWAAHQADDVAGALAAVDPAQPQNALVLRRADEVLVVALSDGAAAFVGALQQRQTLGAAARAGLAASAAFDLAASLALLLRLQALAAPAPAPERAPAPSPSPTPPAGSDRGPTR